MNHCRFVLFFPAPPAALRPIERSLTVARLSPREMRRERDYPGLPDSRYCSCNKATNVPKMRDRAGRHGPVINCAKPETNRIRPPSAPSDYRPRADAMAGIPAHADAWRAAGRQRARPRRRRWRADAHARHRHAWRAGLARPTSAIRPTPIRRRPKAANWCKGVLGTFDSLNPFIVMGLPAANIRSYVIESLLARGYDEPFTLYGLLAESVETDAARSVVTFTLNPAARFADGKPVTPDDVIFSWQLVARQRPAEFPHLLRQGGEGGGDRRAHRALRSHRRRRSRIAADPRPDAGARQARDRSRHVRADDVQAARSAAGPIR